MKSEEIRDTFLSYFERTQGHQRLPSAPLVPQEDPTLLFNVAGMVPLKSYFLGLKTPPSLRMTTCQKCFRTNDIEEVGFTPRHDTFFEMLGNFSIGDYFKKDAIGYAWELLRDRFNLDPERMWITIHPSDDEARSHWLSMKDVTPERVISLEENFWEMGAGVPGPCGYDSEINWDLGIPCSCGKRDCLPDCGGNRWIEVWNLVFMQFIQDAAGNRSPLPKPSIDTGMGLERVTCVLQGVMSIFETDLFAPVIEQLHARSTAAEASAATSANVIADHVRACSFLIADGVLPANEGRGYVLRRLIRRGTLHARRLGVKNAFEGSVGAVCDVMGSHYPELVERRAVIEEVLAREEASFEETLENGMERLSLLMPGASGTISGDDAFKLYDTYGFPVDLTVEVAREHGFAVDIAGFEKRMEGQRERSQKSRQVSRSASRPMLPPTTFVGYERLEEEGKVLYLETGGVAVDELAAGASGLMVVDTTPCYAEAGGQVGDTALITWKDGSGRVTDTVHLPGSDAYGHSVTMEAALRVGEQVTLAVDKGRRMQIARHHSATHLLHKSLRELLGESVVQRGSYVGPEYTTFDFSFSRALTEEELFAIERRINDAIRENYERQVELLSVDAARKTGAMALFGEKYGEVVRVVDFGGWARELCGGTHVPLSGDLGAAIIVSESSIGQGIRRIEMVVGSAAVRRWQEVTKAATESSLRLRSRWQELPDRVGQLQQQLKMLEKRASELERRSTGSAATGATTEQIGGMTVSTLEVNGEYDQRQVVGLVDELFAGIHQGKGVAIVCSAHAIAVKVGQDAIARAVTAHALVQLAAPMLGGKGGGKDSFAQGSVRDAAGIPKAFAALRESLDSKARA